MTDHQPAPDPDLLHEMTSLLNRHSRENASGTPDYILAQYVIACLAAFEVAIIDRDDWWGFTPRIGGTVMAVDGRGDGTVEGPNG